ncbi:MAG: secretin N-terminal domain-containing protein, partial [Vulcanimicrobiaceae bacterium]
MRARNSSARRLCAVAMLFLVLIAPTLSVGAASPRPTVTVLAVSIISPSRAAHVLHTLFPQVAIRVDNQAHAVIVTATPDVTEQMRSVLSGIDVRDPTLPSVSVVPLQSRNARSEVDRIRNLYPSSHL